jgi:hypothetical protein
LANHLHGFSVVDCCSCSGGDKKFIKREEEPDEYWSSKGEKAGANPLKASVVNAAIIGLSMAARLRFWASSNPIQHQQPQPQSDRLCLLAAPEQVQMSILLWPPHLQDPLAIIGIIAILFPFIFVLIAIGTGAIDTSVYRGS